MNYTEATNILNNKRGDKRSKKLENNTYLVRLGENCIAIRLHYTNIIYFYADYIEVNSGGWYTRTTKERINRYLPGPFSLIQKNRLWFVQDNKEGKIPFQDNMKLYL